MSFLPGGTPLHQLDDGQEWYTELLAAYDVADLDTNTFLDYIMLERTIDDDFVGGSESTLYSSCYGGNVAKMRDVLFIVVGWERGICGLGLRPTRSILY